MSQNSVHFSNNGKPVSNSHGSGHTDTKSQKPILSNKGQTQHTKGASQTIDNHANTNQKVSPQFEGLPEHKSNQSHKDNKAETITIDERHPLSVTGSQANTGRYEDDDDKYVNEMKSLVSKIKYKPPVGSLYQRDFVRHPIDPKPPTMDNNPWATFRIEQPMDFRTTKGLDYPDWKQGPPPRHHMDLWKASEKNIPFGGRSSYKAEYLNWGQNPSAMEKPVAPKTVITELPFIGRSLYASDFKQPEHITQVHKVDHNLFGKKSPLGPDIPLLAETSTAKTYQPYKVVSHAHLVQKEKYEKVEPYPGQFTTTYGCDFRDKLHDNKFKTKSFKPKFSLI